MCLTAAYKSRICQHRWLTITRRCGPSTGFTSTPIHEFRTEPFFTSTFSSTPKFITAPAGTCPNCDLQGRYDENTTRMVLWSGDKDLRKQMRRTHRRGGPAWSAGGGHTAPPFYDARLGYGTPTHGVNMLPGQTVPIPGMATANGEAIVANKGQDQALTPYQHAFAVNQVAQANAGLQYHHMPSMPIAHKYKVQRYERSRCSVM